MFNVYFLTSFQIEAENLPSRLFLLCTIGFVKVFSLYIYRRANLITMVLYLFYVNNFMKVQFERLIDKLSFVRAAQVKL